MERELSYAKLLEPKLRSRLTFEAIPTPTLTSASEKCMTPTPILISTRVLQKDLTPTTTSIQNQPTSNSNQASEVQVTTTPTHAFKFLTCDNF